MPAKKKPVKQAPPKRVPPMSRGQTVEETPAERQKRLADEKKMKARR